MGDPNVMKHWATNYGRQASKAKQILVTEETWLNLSRLETSSDLDNLLLLLYAYVRASMWLANSLITVQFFYVVQKRRTS